ncbi:MAG: glycosyltransferase family 39 protein [Burkholderiaceae bacterium]
MRLSNVQAPLDRRTTWLAFLIPLVLLSIRLGGAPLFDVDEGAFSEATREMFERHDFLSTYLNGAHRFDKPILIYWLQAASMRVFGVDEFAFRFPSVIAAAVWCQAVAVFAAPRIGVRNALFGCGIAVTSLGVFVIGRAATADSLLNALIALALFDAWRVVEQMSKGGPLAIAMSRPALYRAYLWIALGVLTKGPVAVLIPVAAVFLFAIVARFVGSRFTPRDALVMFFDPIGWAILIAVAAPWYVAALAIHGRDFIDGFILRHNVERFTGTLQNHSGSAFYYVLMVPLLLWPWLAWLLSAIGSLLRDLRARALDPLKSFLWVWCVFVIVFFSMSGTKLPHYALYGCTPLFVLCAMERERVKRLWLAAIPVLMLIAFVVAMPDLLTHAAGAGWIRDAFYRAMAARAEAATPAFYYPVAWTGAVLVLVALGWPRRRRRARPVVDDERRARRVATRVLEASVIATLLLCSIGAPMLGEVLEGPVKRAALVAKTMPEPAVTWNFHMPSFAVYRERVTPIGAPAVGELALTRIDRLPADANVDRVFEEGGVVLVKRRGP